LGENGSPDNSFPRKHRYDMYGFGLTSFRQFQSRRESFVCDASRQKIK